MKNSRFSNFWNGKGFYAALALCLVGAAAAAWVTVDKTFSSLAETPKETENSPVTHYSEDQYREEFSLFDAEDVASPKEDVRVEEPVSEEKEDETEVTLKLFSREKNFVLPLEGAIAKPHSNGELVKYDALNEWRTHDGIDITADVGTEVKASADGVVARVWNDPLWGTCVEIDHGEGVVSLYSGLAKEGTVESGAKVKGGDVIGTVGETNLAEVSEESHLHFAMKQDGKFIDPMEKIKG